MDFKILNKKNSREKNMTKQENYYAEVFENHGVGCSMTYFFHSSYQI